MTIQEANKVWMNIDKGIDTDAVNLREMLKLEEIMLNALPAINTYYYDYWHVRVSGGSAYRMNSVQIFGPSSIDIEEKLDCCEKMYNRQQESAVFKISPISMWLNSTLIQRGYIPRRKTDIMKLDLQKCMLNTEKSVQERQGDSYRVVIDNHITKEWQSNYFTLNETNPTNILFIKTVHDFIKDPVLCATIYEEDEPVACGQCVIGREYAGLYDVIVKSSHRHRGYGRMLCTSLLHEAALQGASVGYLQVLSDNEKAISLYKKLNYQYWYSYWYMVKEDHN